MQVHYSLFNLPKFRNAVVTIGSFDGVHEGHRRILAGARHRATLLQGELVVVTFEPHPRLFFAPNDSDFFLITSLEEKIKLMEVLGVDHLVVVKFDANFANQSAEAYLHDFLIKTIQAKSIIIGYDHRFGKNRSGDLGFLQREGAKVGLTVEEIPAFEVDNLTVSSTKIRHALQNGDVDLANQLLGSVYSFSGKVVFGRQVGRTLGFPTANIQVDNPLKILPKFGIYAAYVEIENAEQYRAMLYIGERPTLDDQRGLTIEANLLDFEGDLYGQVLRITPVSFRRSDEQQPNLEALSQRIQADKRDIQAFFEQNEKKGTAQKNQTETHPSSDSFPKKDTHVRVAIVILNYNTRQQLLDYLPLVLRYSQGAEIIVADNASPDDSRDVMKSHFPEVRLLELPVNTGFAGGYNEALAQVEADVYVLLNSDVEVTADWLDAPLSLLASRPEVAVVQPKILALRARSRFEYAGAAAGWIDMLGYPFCRGRIFQHIEEDTGQYDTAQPCFWASGAAFFIRAPLYHRFGGFDATYFAHNEEIDLCWRLKRAGYSVWCEPASKVYHLGGGTLDYENPRKTYLNFRNSLFSIIKNETSFNLWWLPFTRLLLDGLAGFRFLAKGQFSNVLAVIRAHFSLYRQWDYIKNARKEAARVVKRERIGEENREGLYKGSIVWQHYARRVKEFRRL